MKIYEFKFASGGTHWVFAPNIIEAKEFYLKYTGCGDFTDTEVKGVPKRKWSNMYLLDPNEIEPEEDENYNEDDYDCGLKIIETFADYAERNNVTDLIATTEV